MTLETIKNKLDNTHHRVTVSSHRALVAAFFAAFAALHSCDAKREVKDLRMLLASEKRVENVYGTEAPEMFFARPDGLRTYIMIDGTSLGTYKKEHEGFDVKQLPYAAK